MGGLRKCLFVLEPLRGFFVIVVVVMAEEVVLFFLKFEFEFEFLEKFWAIAAVLVLELLLSLNVPHNNLAVFTRAAEGATSLAPSGGHTSCRNLMGQTPWRLSAERTITIPPTSSPTCGGGDKKKKEPFVTAADPRGQWINKSPTWMTIWSRRSVIMFSGRSLSDTWRL